MRAIAILLAGAAVIIAVGVAVSAAQPDPATTLRSVQSFASIADELAEIRKTVRAWRA